MSGRYAIPLCLAALLVAASSSRALGQDAPNPADPPAEAPGEPSTEPTETPGDTPAEKPVPDTPATTDETGEAEADAGDTESNPNETNADGEGETEQPKPDRKRAAHPSELEYPELSYDVPSREGMRMELANGMVLWWAQEEGVAGLPPLFRLSAVIRSSTLNNPEGKAGLIGIAAGMMSEGGTAKYPRDELFRELELRAASINAGAGEDSVNVALTCLDGDRAKGLELFDEVLRRPAFKQEDFNRRKGQVRENLKQRNTTPGDIESREWARLLYGDHPSARMITRESLKEITRDDLIAWHKDAVQPQNIMLYGSGSLTPAEAKTALDALFKDWKAGETASTIAPPAAEQAVEPGIYLMDRDQGQAHIRVGHLGYQRDQEDYYALLLMNFALGGGGFSSRITQSVRVANGLSYVSYSRFSMPENYTGSFYAACQTKNETAALATSLLIAEIKRMHDEGISAEELQIAQQYYAGSFPQRFSEPGSTASLFCMGEYYGRPEGYQESWRERINAVTLEDVNRIAKKYLHSDRLVVYILGKAETITQGNPDDVQRATTLEDLGMKVNRVALPDPESLTVKE